jgi:hypothetical protein
MTQTTQEAMTRLVQQLGQAPGLAEQLPDLEGEIVRAALEGRQVYEIAQQQGMSEDAVWRVLSSAARVAAGQSVQSTESGGLGSDTDPGVTGGYGDTGFGSIGNEPPVANPEEPER